MRLFKQNKEKWGNFSGNINIYDNLKDSDIPKLIGEPNIHSIQFYRQFKTPNEKTWKVLNNFYEKYPDIRLHIFWYDMVDFKFLKHLPAVKRFAVTSFMTKDFTPIKDYLDLTGLSIGETKSVAVDLSFISDFKDLKYFYVDGMKKGLTSVSQLKNLEVLTLRGVKLPDLEIIRDLKNIRGLNLLFGSYKNLDAISTQTNLQELEISRTRQIPNFDFLNSLSNLKTLIFEGMSQMESLPSLKGLDSLSKIQIDNNSRLADINTVRDLQSLETFLLFFPENFTATLKKKLIDQAFKIILDSKTINATNMWRLADDKTKQVLKDKKIEFWGCNPEVEKIFDEK
jgi:hypothetical protein